MTKCNSKSSILFTLSAVALIGACSSGQDEPMLDVQDLVPQNTDKADDATDIRVSVLPGGYVIDIYGSIAKDLHQAIGHSSLSKIETNGLVYEIGSRVACVSNQVASACRVVSQDVEPSPGFLLGVHGARFDSAASELFGILADANQVPPQSVSFVETGRFACGKDATSVWCGVRSQANARRRLDVTFDGLEPLGPNFVYEGWLVGPDGAKSSGRFVLMANQTLVGSWVPPAAYVDAEKFVLTIEPAVDDDPKGSNTHVVGGDFVNNSASLSSGHATALGTDFSTALGSYILQTPTTKDVADDYHQGIWFVNSGMPGLTLPKLPDGWMYEGWLVTDNKEVLSTGRFTDVQGADRDGAGPSAGSDPSPNFPGQDFISPPQSARGGRVVITVEPEPDDAPTGSMLKPLLDEVEDVGPGVGQQLGIGPLTQITGAATLR